MSGKQRRCPYLVSVEERSPGCRLRAVKEYCVAYSEGLLSVPTTEEKASYCNGEGFVRCLRYQKHDQWLPIAV